MAVMLDLPDELLRLIYYTLSQLSSLTSLSAVNKRLYNIWTAEYAIMARSVLRRHIPALDEALLCAAIEATKRFDVTAEMLDSMFTALVPAISGNAKMCSTVSSAWHDFPGRLLWHESPALWDSERIARHYYRCRRIPVAYDHPDQRRSMRRGLRAIPLSDLDDQVSFIEWWVLNWQDEDGREMHGMGLTQEMVNSPEDIVCHAGTPDKWYFAVETVNVIRASRYGPTRKIGPPPDMWSNGCCCGFREDWW